MLNPSSLAPASGYNHGVLVREGRLLFVAGQVAWDEHGVIVSDRFAEQFDRALGNVAGFPADFSSGESDEA